MSEIVTCVYCGQEYTTGTPRAKSEALTVHIKICSAHPMRGLEQQLAAANESIAKLQKVVDAVRKITCGPEHMIPTCNYLCMSSDKALCKALAELDAP